VPAPGPGVYRVEAHVPGWDVPWVMTNPIYLFPDAARTIFVENSGERIHLSACGVKLDARSQQAYPTIYVVAYRTRRNDTMWIFGCCNASDRKAIALVHIGHDDHRPNQPR